MTLVKNSKNSNKILLLILIATYVAILFIKFNLYVVIIYGVPISIAFFIIWNRPWRVLLKLAVLLTVLAIISILPIFIYGNGCTFRYEKDYSYLVPLGRTIELPSYGQGILTPKRVCTAALTPDFLAGHYLIADLAIISWIIYFLSKPMLKNYLYKNPLSNS